MSVPTLTCVVAITVYVFDENTVIDAATLFTALSAFGSLRFPLIILPMTLSSLAQAKVSARRIDEFLKLPEIRKDALTRMKEAPHLIEFKNASFFWGDPSSEVAVEAAQKLVDDAAQKVKDKAEALQPVQKGSSKKLTKAQSRKLASDKALIKGEAASTRRVETHHVLHNVSLHVDKGERVGVIGSVGCGKSSLINAILGELYNDGGEVVVQQDMKVSYVAQTPWMLNATIRENIIFNDAYDEDKYIRIVQATQLVHDINILDDGDQTMIGEKGINLSGGQKQRIAIARACYATTDLLILDDPLSALDPAVATSVFRDCIQKFIAPETTVLMVTNQLQHLPKLDRVFEVEMEVGKGARVVATDKYKSEIMEDEEESEEKPPLFDPSKGESGKLFQAEDRAKGSVPFSTYLLFAHKGGMGVFAGAITATLLAQAVSLLNQLLIAIWSNDAAIGYQNFTIHWYLAAYAITAIVTGILQFGRNKLFGNLGLFAATSMHKDLLKAVFYTRMLFFDTTPTGRILQRFNKDISSVDSDVANVLSFFVFMVFWGMTTFGTLIYATPWISIAIVILGVLYLRLLNYYRPVLRDTKRLDAIHRSPVYNHFSETLDGMASIRAFGVSQQFIDKNVYTVSGSLRMWYANKTCERWLSVRLETMAAAITSISAIMCVWQAVEGSLSPGVAGLALTFSMTLSLILNSTIRTFSELEASMNGVERLMSYCDTLKSEDDLGQEPDYLLKDW